MPYNSRQTRYRRKRRGASSSKTLKKGWKQRARRQKGGLVARTALANRKQIKRINKSIETKMIELPTCTAANSWRGQNLVRISVDINGQDPASGAPLVMKPFAELSQGDTSAERTGDWVKVKSLTYKVFFESVTGLLPETNRMGLIVVLDRQPTNSVIPSLTGVVPGTLDEGSLLGGNSQLPHLRFQDMSTCGKTQRYKVLRHHRTNVQSFAAGTVFPESQYLSATINNPYNIKYDNDGDYADAPLNQQILFFLYSDSGAAPHPRVSIHTRYRFKDA